MKTLKIGKVKLDGNLILAPMAGVTDLPFRILCKEQGADLICTEMVSAKGIYYNNKNTKDLLKIDDIERPVSLQLFGSDPDIVSQMAKKIEELNFDILDINMGCPVPKVVNNKEGSALLQDIPLAYKILKKTVDAIDKPVTVKIRKGFHRGERQALEMAKAAEQAGVSAIAIHGRTREEYYSGKADWTIIKEIKEAVSIPVIGNGDVESIDDYIRIQEETACDGVMIGRAARGNPWIFRQIKHYEETGERLGNPDFKTVCDMILRHARMQIEWKGEDIGIREMRSHIAWYTAGYPYSALLRKKANTIESYKKLEELLKSRLDMA